MTDGITINLDAAKLAQLEALNQNLEKDLNFDIVFEGATFQADTKSYQEILNSLVTELPPNFYWVDKDNNKISMNKEKLQLIANLIQAKRFEIFNLHQINKDKVRAATSLAGLFN
jgi:hypothetical protein